ncbi:YheC/YheD family protein [Heyndrickxia sp. NPDC080065]|uniref:YheC/YheD family endospore coat-associated protein n=1 Tax=Heyndrickxia sp. NPDC080065 TaxID=3390568 RepID=UPI003D0420DE
MVYEVLIQPSLTLSDDFPTVEISDGLLKNLNIPFKETIEIKLGGEEILVRLNRSQHSSDKETIFFNQSCFLAAKLPFLPIKLQAIAQHHCLILGPIVAVITEIKMNKGESPLFSSIQTFCEELHEYSRQYGGLFYVTNLSRFPNAGFYYDQGNWIENLTPKANIIYNRIHSRRIEDNPKFQLLKKKWEKDGFLLFNASYLTKWQVHETIFKKNYLNVFLPKTSLFKEVNVDQWILKYKDLYLKPDTGSQGRQIIHFFINDNHFDIEQISFSKETNYSFSTLKKALEQIKEWIGTKKFIVQETIPLIQIDGKRIDFRFLCIKKSIDQWNITSAVARMSGDKHFVSNIAQGGTIIRPEKILTILFEKEKAAQTLLLMKELALEIASAISDGTDGLIGELGIDIGVDYNGRPWLIEVNSKPSKQKVEDSPMIRPSAKAIYHYCKALWIERSMIDD